MFTASGDLQTFLSDNSNWLTACAILLLALVIARVVDFAIGRHAKPIVGAVSQGELSQIAVTRLRLLRRLTFVTIVALGFALAASQFEDLRRVATGLLASSAVLGIVVGFAARQTLANGIAGIMVAIVQPIRIGDLVDFQGDRGTVEDIGLTYTFIRQPDGRRLIVPNEQIASSSIHNLTIAGTEVMATASIWVSPDHTVTAVDLLRDGMENTDVTITDTTFEASQITLNRSVEPASVGLVGPAMMEQAMRLLHEQLPAGATRTNAKMQTNESE